MGSAARSGQWSVRTDELFVNVSEEERRKIICDNAVKFWKLGS